ncbi:MAG: CehA/McbA family metallohydrolase [Nocardioides sp.]
MSTSPDPRPATPQPQPSRRSLLRGAAAVGGAAIVLAPLQFSPATAAGGTRTRTITGHLDPGAADWVYVPVDVPTGVNRIDVSYSYSKPTEPAGTATNSCDIGVFDQRGTDLGTRGFRGWSGGARTSFSIAADQATPGYLPGPVESGRWHVALGPYQVCPEGMDYTVTVTLAFGPTPAAFVPAYPPQAVAGRGAGWYRGDCHLHTVYSDGKRQPSEVASGARAAGLDFIVSTEHNTSSAHGVWGPLAGDDLLVVTGEEITTRNGHVLALGLTPGHWVDWRFRSRDDDFGGIADLVRGDGGIVVPAHPHCAYVGCRWKFGYADADALEVWNGPWTLDDEMAVETWDAMLVDAGRTGGRWLPAMGNSDAHSDPQVIGLPQTVVHAQALSRDGLVAGLRAGRSWLAESRSVSLAVSAAGGGRSAGIGERLAAGAATPVTVTATVAGVPNGVVRFITDEGQLKQVQLDASGAGTATLGTTPQQATYVRVEVRHPLADGSAGNGNAVSPTLQLGPMAALANPVWLDF